MSSEEDADLMPALSNPLSVSLSASFQEVGPNTAGDVGGIRQQGPPRSRLVPALHAAALDHGAASVVRHGHEEPAARRAALALSPRIVPFFFCFVFFFPLSEH